MKRSEEEKKKPERVECVEGELKEKKQESNDDGKLLLDDQNMKSETEN